VLGPLVRRRAVRRKRRAELAFWQGVAAGEPELQNFWYEAAFTTLFGIERSWYAGRRMLDVGCGPRGSLEWAHDAAERVGADPLADRYVELNGGRHAMRYVRARAEELPFADVAFDVVSSFNALDHVEDPDAAIAELVRVLAPGGTLLVVVEIDHPPTVTEPLTFDRSVVDRFGLAVRSVELVGQRVNLYSDLEQRVPHVPDRPGWLVARLQKPAVPAA
jgi:ubiquinone/menaquinone biosynthesis C-methylase UbiE